MQFIGEWMKAHCISNFTDVFRKTIWNLVKSLEVMLTAGQACQIAGPHILIQPCATNHLLVNTNAFAMGQNLHWYTY